MTTAPTGVVWWQNASHARSNARSHGSRYVAGPLGVAKVGEHRQRALAECLERGRHVADERLGRIIDGMPRKRVAMVGFADAGGLRGGESDGEEHVDAFFAVEVMLLLEDGKRDVVDVQLEADLLADFADARPGESLTGLDVAGRHAPVAGG